MKPPIIVIEGDDIAIYQSIEEVEQHIEPPDISAGVAYDSEGRLLKLVKQVKEESKSHGLLYTLLVRLTGPIYEVKVIEIETQPKHACELREQLVRALARMGISEEFLSKASLEELVIKASEYFLVR